jgi:hypothetical protein
MPIKIALKIILGTLIGGAVGLGLAYVTSFFGLIGLPLMLCCGLLGGAIVSGVKEW